MQVRRTASRLGRGASAAAWWATIAPFCVATNLPRVGADSSSALHLGGEPDHFPVTELLGRLVAFRDRLRLVRALIILFRAATLAVAMLLLARIYELASNHLVSVWLPLGVFLVLLWAVHLALHHRITPFEVARLVDRNRGLNAQVATAVEFTVSDQLDRPLARAQIRQATNQLRELDPGQTIPFHWPGRDAKFLGALVLLYGLASGVGPLAPNLHQQLQPIDAAIAQQATREAQAPSPFVTIDPAQLAMLQSESTSLGATAAAANPVENQLNALQQQLQSQAISSAEYQQQLHQVQQQIQAQASQSLDSQAALNALAAALKDSSTTQSISDSLNQGNYNQAAEQLNQLSNQLGQLSPQARVDLMKQLSQAAGQTSKLNQPISQSAADTASALQSGQTAAAQQSMQNLAQAVQQASNQVSQQAQLGQALSDVQQKLSASGASTTGEAAANQPSASPTTGPASSGGQISAPPPANGQDGSQRASADSGPASNNGSQTGGTSGQAATRTAVGPIQQAGQGQDGGAGNGPGGNPLGANNPLDVQGVKVTIVGKASATGTSSTSAGDRSVPLTSADSSTISGMSGASGAPSNVPINVHTESNVVPLDKQPVVRDYFSNGATGSGGQ